MAGAACLLAGGFEALAQAAEQDVGAEGRTALTVTIYNRDLGLVRDLRRVDFAVGDNVLALGDVSPALRPETLALAGDGLALLDQSFAFDLLTPQRILQKSVGDTVLVVRSHPETGEESAVEAELLAVAGGVVLRIGDRFETGPAAGGGRLAFRELPAGLRREPALVARLASEGAGERVLVIEYLTGGLTWQADYRAEINAAEDRLQLTGLVTLTNSSGLGYANANVRLVAGEVNQTGPAPMQRGAVAMMAEAAAPAPGMAAQAAGDQHLYQVPRPVSLADRETKQVLLLESRDVPVEKEYRFEELVHAQGGPEEVGPVSASVVFRFDNEADKGGPGQPLPGGIVRVYQPGGASDPDGDGGEGGGAPVFTGEDRIGHTPEGEEVRLAIARAFDVTGRARITAYERLSNTSYRTAQEIVVANAKDEAVRVKVVGHMPAGWRMLEESRPHEEETASRIAWALEVPAGGEATLTYRVQVTRP